MPLTNFGDEFFDNLPARPDPNEDEEEKPQDQELSDERSFIRNLNEYPFLRKAASGEISFDAIAQQLGYKHRSGALRFLRRGYAKLRKQFEAKHHPD